MGRGGGGSEILEVAGVAVADPGEPRVAVDRQEPRGAVLAGPVEDRPIGGLGLHILKKMGLQLAYRRDAGRNVLRVEFPEE